MAMNPISKRADLDSLIDRFNWKATVSVSNIFRFLFYSKN